MDFSEELPGQLPELLPEQLLEERQGQFLMNAARRNTNAAAAVLFFQKMNKRRILVIEDIINTVSGFLLQRTCNIKGIWYPASETPSKGDIICVSRGWYLHYGIFNNRRSVIHYSSDTSDISLKNIVMETTFCRFLDGEIKYMVPDFESGIARCLRQDKVMIPGNCQGDVFSPEAVVRRAKSMIGVQHYNLFFNNCEHFAFWCKTGISCSSQSDTLLDVIEKGISRITGLHD